jgi:hypothetical protein
MPFHSHGCIGTSMLKCLNTGSYSFNLLKINNFFDVASWMGVHHLVSWLKEENFLLNYKKKIIFLNTRHGHR